MRTSPLPQPEQYSDWREWARALLAALDAEDTPPASVTGSKGGNVALTNLLAALAEAGIVDDRTT